MPTTVATPRNQSRNRFDDLLVAFGLVRADLERSPVSLNPRIETYIELVEAFTLAESSNDDDGIGPLRFQAVFDAAVLLSRLIGKFVVPAILPLPRGAIGIQWNGEQNSIFTGSFYGNGLIVFAGIFSDTRRIRGICDCINPSPEFLASLEDFKTDLA